MISVKKQIQNFTNSNDFKGGYIGLSTLVNLTGLKKINLLPELVKLSKKGQINLHERYFCPDGHFIRNEDKCFCQDCNYPYYPGLIEVTLSIEPVKEKLNLVGK